MATNFYLSGKVDKGLITSERLPVDLRARRREPDTDTDPRN